MGRTTTNVLRLGLILGVREYHAKLVAASDTAAATTPKSVYINWQ
jgi:hypothetical protein